jgi:uncharacterized cofD-like protein
MSALTLHTASTVPDAGAPTRLQGAGIPARPRVVALGGGTGLPILLRGLLTWLHPAGSGPGLSARDALTAIVSVADDGGSSGRLRRAYDMPPLGDLRNCLLALASESAALRPLFSYRFEGRDDVGGHSLGNLMLAAMARTAGDLADALEHAGELLGVRGRVFPASLRPLTLRACFEDGTIIEGESLIAGARRPIRYLEIDPASPEPFPGVERALQEADLILIGPGSLYTSLLPVLLIPRIAQAIAGSAARIALVCNLLTEPGETDGFSAADFVVALRDHIPGLRLDDILLHDGGIPAASLRGTAPGTAPVAVDLQPLRFLGVRALQRDLAGWGGPARHDPVKLGRLAMEVALESTRGVSTP